MSTIPVSRRYLSAMGESRQKDLVTVQCCQSIDRGCATGISNHHSNQRQCRLGWGWGGLFSRWKPFLTSFNKHQVVFQLFYPLKDTSQIIQTKLRKNNQLLFLHCLLFTILHSVQRDLLDSWKMLLTHIISTFQPCRVSGEGRCPAAVGGLPCPPSTQHLLPRDCGWCEFWALLLLSP